MRFAGIKELKQQTMDIIKESKKGDIIITAYGKPAAVLHYITEDDLADYLLRTILPLKRRSRRRTPSIRQPEASLPMT